MIEKSGVSTIDRRTFQPADSGKTMRLRKSLTSQDSAAEAEAGLVETAAAGLADLGRSEDGGVRRAGGSRPLGRGREGPRSVQCFSWSVRGKPRRRATGN